MVHGDRNYNQEAIANLNSTSPLTFTEAISAEDLARDLDLFANTQFFDFDFGGSSTSTAFTPIDTAALKQQHEEPDRPQSDNGLNHGFNFLSDSLSFDINNLNADDEQSHKRRKFDPESSEKPEDTPLSGSGDEAARAAAEEDKRRRNTLASARFRAKKKMREQALEKDHKEMLAKIEKMENRIKELELENKWLRGLVVKNKQ